MGGASPSTRFSSTASAAARRRELGRNGCSTCSDLGRAAACRAAASPAATTSRSGCLCATGAKASPTAATGGTGSCPRRRRANMGIAPGRVAGTRGTFSRWMGAARAVVGRCAAGRPVWSGRH